jgi:hypothetical protein
MTRGRGIARGRVLGKLAFAGRPLGANRRLQKLLRVSHIGPSHRGYPGTGGA